MEILSMLLGGGLIAAVFEGVKYFVDRSDKKKEKHDEIKDKLDILIKNDESMQRGIERTQLMLLISDYPTRTDEIMEVAESYFKSHHGNWYCHRIFRSWCEEQNIEIPIWFE